MNVRGLLTRSLGICFLLAISIAPGLSAQPFERENVSFSGENLYYSIEREAQVYSNPGVDKAFTLGMQEAVHVIEEDGFWSKIRTDDGAEGYIARSAISNIWIRISKRKKSVYVYEGVHLLKKIPADFGNNVVSDKIRRGDLGSPDDWRTPEGTFFVVSKNPNSQYYKAFVFKLSECRRRQAWL